MKKAKEKVMRWDDESNKMTLTKQKRGETNETVSHVPKYEYVRGKKKKIKKKKKDSQPSGLCDAKLCAHSVHHPVCLLPTPPHPRNQQVK